VAACDSAATRATATAIPTTTAATAIRRTLMRLLQLAAARKRLCSHSGVEMRDLEGMGKTDLLGSAANYAVFDPRGRRIGLVIELVDDPESGGQRLAIRRDGIFLWRRRLLPLDAVETIDAERRYVVVDEDRETARVAATPEAIDGDSLAGDSLARVYYYTRPQNVRNSDETARGFEEEERSVTLSPAAGADRYLRFVSTPNGYRLDEQDGEPPAVGTPINGIDLPERLVVAKLGPSPLPHDPRVCAFLEAKSRSRASPGRSRA
jgi:hypothetical protein